MLFRLCEEKQLADRGIEFCTGRRGSKKSRGRSSILLLSEKKKEMTMGGRKIQTAERGKKRKGERWWAGHRRKSIRVKRRKQTKILLYILIKRPFFDNLPRFEENQTTINKVLI